MTRAPCGAEEKGDGLKKGPWTPDEDHKLLAYIQKHGRGSWRSLPLNAGLQRCGKSCRLRWTNYLRPDIKRGTFSHDEEQTIVHLHAILGNRWSAIASYLPRRTDNEIKNYWNTHLKKRLLQLGIDPVTHQSTDEFEGELLIPGLLPAESSHLTHTSQWNSFRAEAEARLTAATAMLPPPGSEFQGSATASTDFMSSWKERVTKALQPSFGAVELHKSSPVNLQTFLQDWKSSLQAGSFGIDVFDCSSSTPSPAAPSICDAPLFSASMDIAENLEQVFSLDSLDSDCSPCQSSTFSLAGMCCDRENQFSPTSTLRDYDYPSYSPYMNTGCSSSNFSGVAMSKVATISPQQQALFSSREQAGMADPGFHGFHGFQFHGTSLVSPANTILPVPDFEFLM